MPQVRVALICVCLPGSWGAYLAVRKYVEGTKDVTQLLDLLSATGAEDADGRRGPRAALYPEVQSSRSFEHPCPVAHLCARSLPDQYLPSATLSAGIKAGALHQGYFNASAYNYLEVRSRLCLFDLSVGY